MPIPQLTADGYLPEGIHDAELEEIEEMFCRFQHSDRRRRLCARLRAYLAEVSTWGQVLCILMDGSFVSKKDEPSDIDLILVRKPGADLAAEVLPAEYNVISRRRVRRGYGFDVVAVLPGSPGYERWLKYFSQDTRRPELAKGLIRIAV